MKQSKIQTIAKVLDDGIKTKRNWGNLPIIG